MTGSLARRIAKLEPRATRILVPNVISVRRGETADDARARFRAEHGAKLTAYHGLIVLPERISTPEAEADFAVRFFAHRTQLVANAKSARSKDEFDG